MPLVPLSLTTTDGETLEAELARPTDGEPVRAGIVLCHPHPLHGGTMRSMVISSLFIALPDAGVMCLRFNFRGVEGSSGSHDNGDAECLDARAAIDALLDFLPPGAPLILAGWSFGADVALSVQDPALAAWLAVASPLRFGRELEATSSDPRPKLFLLAQRDEIRPAEEVAHEVADWTNTRVVIVPGASHFFIGSTEKLVTHARRFVDELTGSEPRSAP